MTLWRLAYRILIVSLGSICMMLSPILPATSRSNHDDIPALLQFAEKYNEQAQSSGRSTYSYPAKNSVKRPPSGKPAPSRSEQWRMKDKEILRQDVEISALKAQIAYLKQSGTTPMTMPNLTTLSKFAQGLRQALGISPTERQAKAGILQLQQIWEKDREALQQQLSKAKSDNQILSTTVSNKKDLLIEAESRTAVLQERLEELHTQRQLMQTELDDTVQQLANARAESISLHAKIPRKISEDELKDSQSRENYAAGVSLGEEILQMQQERQLWGVNADKQMILAGITDTFANKRVLSDDELNKALTAGEAKVTNARAKVSSAQRQKGTDYINAFKKDKRVYQASSGFWYRIDYAGDSKIPETASVDVVVKESLVDGTVIQDMEASGATLSQPVDNFPPLFQEALVKLKNHGSMTLVVPPELAYGENGYAPKIPPNATMIYTLRIAETYPEPRRESH